MFRGVDGEFAVVYYSNITSCLGAAAVLNVITFLTSSPHLLRTEISFDFGAPQHFRSPRARTFVVLSVRNQRVGEIVGSVNHADIILLPRVLVSDCETRPRAVAARCVTLLRPHFLFVMAAGYIWSGVSGCYREAIPPFYYFHDSGSDDVAVSYLHLRKNRTAA